jgi:formamidopyrimidine-DNA glycosylase
MPELPEVEHARRWLARRVQGHVLRAVTVADPGAIRTRLSSRPADADPDGEPRLGALVGRRFLAPRRIGKRLALPLDGGGLLAHLGMTGRFVAREARPTHGRVGLVVGDGPPIWFEDPRRFGCLALSDDPGAALAEGLGPDALDAPLPPDALARALAGAPTLKAALLDQGRLAGIGNIQAVEALWLAALAPDRRPTDVGPEGYARLAAALQETLRRTLDLAADDEEMVYVSSDRARNPFRVYGRAGAPCPRCGALLSSEKLQGRTTASCPACQPPARGGADRRSR